MLNKLLNIFKKKEPDYIYKIVTDVTYEDNGIEAEIDGYKLMTSGSMIVRKGADPLFNIDGYTGVKIKINAPNNHEKGIIQYKDENNMNIIEVSWHNGMGIATLLPICINKEKQMYIDFSIYAINNIPIDDISILHYTFLSRGA